MAGDTEAQRLCLSSVIVAGDTEAQHLCLSSSFVSFVSDDNILEFSVAADAQASDAYYNRQLV